MCDRELAVSRSIKNRRGKECAPLDVHGLLVVCFDVLHRGEVALSLALKVELQLRYLLLGPGEGLLVERYLRYRRVQSAEYRVQSMECEDGV